MSYTAYVAAMGPSGVARSTRSNTFNFTGIACSFNVSSTLLNAPATGGSYATTVATSKRLCVDRCQQQHQLDHGDGRQQWQWQRHGESSTVAANTYRPAQRHRYLDDRRCDC